MARSILEEDGEHAAMYFLAYADGRPVESSVFEEEHPEDSVGPVRARQMAEAVRSTGADALVLISEAWGAEADAVPVGGRIRDAATTEDVLLVAGIERGGETITLETPIFRDASGTVTLGESRQAAGDYHVATFDDARAVWGLPLL